MSKNSSSYKWFMLALLTLTGTFAVAIPFSCMPVLFKEISGDLSLSLVQIGTIWGVASLAGLCVSLVAGVLGDRFGMKLVISVCCILVGITGALRGISTGFFSLMALVFINGLVRLIVPVNSTKATGIWFKGKYLGLAMGITAMGVGLGLMLGPLVSATILSPLLGGWRNVLYLYGAVSIVIGVIWFIFGRDPPSFDPHAADISTVPFRQAFSKLIRNRSLWLLALTMMLRIACFAGMSGYLPLYLQNQGWSEASADSTLAVFYAVSTASVIPISLLSDRLHSRKAILFPGLLVPFICVALIPLVNSSLIWVLMILSGLFMDSFMAVSVTTILETKGVGSAFAGTAVGIVFTITQVGGVVSPPLGNSLASINPGSAFFFWASLSALGLVTLFFATETATRKAKAADIN